MTPVQARGEALYAPLDTSLAFARASPDHKPRTHPNAANRSHFAMPTLSLDLPSPPQLVPMAQVRCDVDAVTSLGPAPYGERRFVPLRGGTVQGAELCGVILDGGVDWQISRVDGVLDIEAHYVIRTPDGGLIEVTSSGMRHGPADVLARLLRGDEVDPSAYFFRTLMRFQTGAPAWLHLNKVMAIAVGARRAKQVCLDVYRVT